MAGFPPIKGKSEMAKQDQICREHLNYIVSTTQLTILLKQGKCTVTVSVMLGGRYFPPTTPINPSKSPKHKYGLNEHTLYGEYSCWKTILHGSLPSLAFLWAEALTIFVPNSLLCHEQLWKTEAVCPLQSKGQVCLLPSIIKIVSPFTTKGRFTCHPLQNIWVP